MSGKSLAHAIVSDYLHIAKEIGRPPSQEYYFQNGIYSKRNIESTFGGWTQLIQAAGYQIPSTKKIDKEEIKKKTFEDIKNESDQRFIVSPPLISKNTLIIGDTHFPYTHPDAVIWLIELNKKYKYDLVIHVGDEIDYHAMSFHDKDSDLFSAGHELDEAIKMMQPLYKEFPKVKLVESNHGSMTYRKAKHHGFPRRLLKSYRDALEAPDGWEWSDKIRFQCPDGQMNLVVHSLGANVEQVAKSRGMNVIQGHHHEKFGYMAFHNEEKNRVMFGAQTACLVNDASMALAYNKINPFRPIMGSFSILDGSPFPLEMFLDHQKRWNGRLP